MPILLYIKIGYKVSYTNGLKVFVMYKLFTNESNIIACFDVTIDIASVG